jgi:hypothetical protein
LNIRGITERGYSVDTISIYIPSLWRVSMPKFRVVEGTHYRGSKRTGNLEKYIGGDVLEERFNLAARHKNKFVRVSDDTPVTDPKENEDPLMGLTEDHFDRLEEIEDRTPDYHAMSTKELRRIAQEMKIDLTGVKSKEEVISMIQAAKVVDEP